MSRLPPLAALRAFESAGRLLSFKQAAAELGVTPAAISHQIRFLEQELGIILFERRNRAVSLTDPGRRCWVGVREAFERLRTTLEEVRDSGPPNQLTVGVGPSFTVKWLLPRLPRFSTEHPEIDVRVLAWFSLPYFPSGDSDVAIVFSRECPPGMRADRLFGEILTPLCSPKLIERNRLRRPADLSRHVLLHDDSLSFVEPNAPTWRDWLAQAGVTTVDSTRGPHFSHADHAIAAAVDGLGVVLGRCSLAADEMERGSLVRPFAQELTMPHAFHMFTLRQRSNEPKIAAFRDWIIREAATHPTAAAGMPKRTVGGHSLAHAGKGRKGANRRKRA